LGAETILTGITAQDARTIIQLGVDISTMYTLSRLAEGIELALSMSANRYDPTGDRLREWRGAPHGSGGTNDGSIPILRIGRTLLTALQSE
jgi:hypothetical protein